MSEQVDRTPEGDPIDARTLWLDFGEQGETAISLDLTRWNAAFARRKPRPESDDS